MGGKSPDPPPPPDYSAVAAASEASSKYAYQLGKDQLAFFKKQYTDNKQVSDVVTDFALGVMERNDINAQKDRARYEAIFQPLEEQLAYDAEKYSSPEQQEYEAGKAAAEVQQQVEMARATALDRLESYGIDPSQARAGALDLQTRVAAGAQAAGAANTARERTQQIGRALRSEAINIGKGYPGQIAGTYGTAQQAGNQGVNTGLATTQSAASTMGTPVGWQALGNQAIGQWGSILNTGYQNQLDAFKAEQQSSSGMGGALGLITGIAGKAFGFEGGGAIPEEPMPGLPVLPAMSPSGGAQVDDVPAQVEGGPPAKLNVGEFVLPDDVMRWKGEEWAQKQIVKAREEMQGGKGERPAKPSVTPAIPMR